MSQASGGNGGPGSRPGVILEQTHVTTAVGGRTVDGRVAEPFLQEASTALLAGDWAAAEDAFARGIAVSPLDARLHGGLALIAIHQQDWRRAISHGRQAAALPGSGVEVHNNLGWALEQQGQIEEAIRAYQSGFQLDPTRPEPIHHLVRLGHIPRDSDDEEEGEPVALETLQRLELYEHLAGFLRREPPGNLWRGTYLWATQRNAPWGRVAAWLHGQGCTSDAEILQRLVGRDEHLGESVVQGMLLGERDAMLKAFEGVDAVSVLGADDPMPESAGDDSRTTFLVVRTDDNLDRVQIPPQRTHAGVVYSIVTALVDQFGGRSAAVMTIDPAAHLGPRRVWLLAPLVEVEVVGTWTVEDDAGEPAPGVPVPDGSTVRAASVLLDLPGIDAKALAALIAECKVSEQVRPARSGGGVVYDADGVGRQADAWRAFLSRVTGWIPEGSTSFAVWRQGGIEHLGVLERAPGVRFLRLVPSWPSEQDSLDLPLPADVQMLGRALFQAPRIGRLLGTRAKG